MMAQKEETREITITIKVNKCITVGEIQKWLEDNHIFSKCFFRKNEPRVSSSLPSVSTQTNNFAEDLVNGI
ncbi:hypothetical protein KAS08_02435 [Candidatus Pacearchaeota archaeon]|nr:hypothetical protein [Candidatus Pacearchaeota archaeon]